MALLYDSRFDGLGMERWKHVTKNILVKHLMAVEKVLIYIDLIVL